MGRFKLIKQSCREEESEHICELARAGMSVACIAAEVFGTMPNRKPTKDSIRRVGYVLWYFEVRVTDYRNGRNKLGKSMISAICREANVVSAIRLAAGKQAAAFSRQAI